MSTGRISEFLKEFSVPKVSTEFSRAVGFRFLKVSNILITDSAPNNLFKKTGSDNIDRWAIV